eukprot:TRINITY_DN51568_c0_g1_i1.p1 TRINITY_DN51568_c0_g1~~TRINITY_DN51568_c0_g1_i1.p1  ORF type:complete len:339 (-),score=42.85 TRINITY_DN51568_c0_g1_i1:151-1167(-)
MDVLSEIVFCEPTVTGQIGAALLHLLLWSFITNYDYGVMAHVNRWVRKQSWYPTVQENYKEDDAQKVYGFPDPGFNYICFCATVLHHGTGGVLMGSGMLLGKPWLWRHGMLVEVGGMDLLDAVRIAHVKLLPPGTFPTSLFMQSKLFAPLMFFHHSVGLCVGIPVNMYFSDVYIFQLFGLVILGFPAICLAPSLLVKTLDREVYSRVLLANNVYLFVTFSLVSRTLYYFPAAWRCFMHIWQSNLGSSAVVMVPFTWALIAMSLFNVMILCIQLQGFCKIFTQRKESAIAKSTSSTSLVDVVANVSVQSGLTGVFVASRLVARAHVAKEHVKDRHSKDS